MTLLKIYLNFILNKEKKRNKICIFINNKVTIPTELIGSLPRSIERVDAHKAHKDETLTADQLALLREKDIQKVLFELERNGSPQLTDGELTKLGMQ